MAPQPVAAVRPRNDPLQYEDLAGTWWDPRGPLAMLHWIARARAARIPVATRPDALLVDLGCGAGLLAPHLADKGYRHVGVDLSASALAQAGAHGVEVVRADVTAVPLDDEVADVVSAGEILEHVEDLAGAVSEACRVLRPGGLLVLDTIARTRLARLLAVQLAERLPLGAPKNIHDPALFVDRGELVRLCAAGGVGLRLNGLRPSFLQLAAFWCRLGERVDMVTTRPTGVLFQAIGTKSP